MVKQLLKEKNIGIDGQDLEQGENLKEAQGEEEGEEQSSKKQKIIKENMENQSEVVPRDEEIGKKKTSESEADPDIEEEETDALVVDCA